QLHDSNKWFTFSALLVFNASWLLFSSLFSLYTKDTLSVTEKMLRFTFRTLLAHTIFFTVLYYLFNSSNFNAKFVIATFCSISVLLIVSRFLLTYAMEFLFKKVMPQKRIAIVGNNNEAVKLAEFFNNNKSFYNLTEIVGADSKIIMNSNGSLIGNVKDYVDFAVENKISEIYSTILPTENKQVQELAQIAENRCVRVRFVTEKSVDSSDYFHVDFFSQMPVISLRAEPLLEGHNSLKKRVFDLLVSSAVIIFLLSWLTPLLAILIKLSSKGPVFFKQERSGRNNKSFWCYKFRSMTINGGSDAFQATKNDNRVTRLGSFLRKTSIDELPQFFNVIKGNMSISGPRPHMLLHTTKYSAIINQYMVRQFLKPGITGWAQVNGYRGETSDTSLMEKRIEHDIWYMENWSLMLDIKIVFMTAINIFKGESNAY
ncbi:MAG: undecaprenyl-phosphate glucose phosphotransferase, partial [Bacteroidota bacterium]|nr:undecaprenyl-phosphate glucose phosphotransferase [Bacteroidota bacterium]